MSRLILALSLLVGACKNDTTKLQYMPDMADAPTVKPQEEYLDPPIGSVARGAIRYAATAEESTKKPTVAVNLAQGKQLYETFCFVCHGSLGKGNGPITSVYPKPPDITQKIYQDRSDGFIFHRITFGTAIMPGYGHATYPHERWQIVYYLRTLQGRN